jgi:hypothetical protein
LIYLFHPAADCSRRDKLLINVANQDTFNWNLMLLNNFVCGAAVRMLVLIGAVTAWQPVRGQEASPPSDLRIVVVRGEGFTNNLKKRIAREPIVEVRDRNNRPVSGATVTFLLPGGGPGGTFANGQQTLTVFTGQNGRAIATGFTPNNVAGPFNINVTASMQGQTATATISQTNAITGAGTGLGTGATLGIVGAAAAAVASIVAISVTGGKSARVNVGAPSVQ